MLRQGGDQMPVLKNIYRYPIKGLSPQAITRVALEPGGAVPFDRVFALARPGAPIDPAEPKWAKKSLFLMLMLDDGLAEVRLRVGLDDVGSPAGATSTRSPTSTTSANGRRSKRSSVRASRRRARRRGWCARAAAISWTSRRTSSR